MTATRRRGRPGHDLESVLATSVAAFTEQGFDATSMDDLARRLGVGKSALYHHVESKDALLALALDRALAGLEQLAEAVRGAEGPALDRLETLVRGSVRVLVAERPYVTLLLRVHGNSDVEREALRRRRRLDRLGSALVREAVDEGALPADLDAAVTARLLFGMVNSITGWLRDASAQDAERLADTVVALAFDGLRRRSLPPS
ncbi:TetR/AcrR family transcriptional regulator [Jatrophihabitans endophyticus]|uniref:TetR/AcrR family transcriptional regulator n=1 Tax=Jatrophihabitans endophyticus TaxID=1206085 RepID=UPI0019E84F24|nr:TetR/AcrR family transcriptional regulator [Jatrophihabitans endophyticus]MBE7189972.1 TetR family transcriptional regulator [Jatrophihabitans endophyticus]